MEYYWQGLQDYQSILDHQKESLSWPPEKEEIWGLEHSLVVSLGKRSNGEREKFSHPWPVVQSDRGGMATLHSPGQLVIYPLISIAKRGWGPRHYVCQLLKVTQTSLLELGLRTQIDDLSSGLFIGEKKLCFIGLRVSQGRVYHGLSLNVCNDLNFFDGISACGWKGRPLTSLKEQGVEITPEELFNLWKKQALQRDCF